MSNSLQTRFGNCEQFERGSLKLLLKRRHLKREVKNMEWQWCLSEPSKEKCHKRQELISESHSHSSYKPTRLLLKIMKLMDGQFVVRWRHEKNGQRGRTDWPLLGRVNKPLHGVLDYRTYQFANNLLTMMMLSLKSSVFTRSSHKANETAVIHLVWLFFYSLLTVCN